MHDPYAPPSQDVRNAGPTNYAVVGDMIECRTPLVLPDHICARCGSEKTGGKNIQAKASYWTPSWVWVTILITWLLTIILHYVLRKKLVSSYYTCPDCVSNRKTKLMISVAITVVGLVGFIGGMAIRSDFGVLILIGGMLSFIVGLIALIVFASPILTPKKYDQSSMTFMVSGPKPDALRALSNHVQRTASQGEVATW